MATYKIPILLALTILASYDLNKTRCSKVLNLKVIKNEYELCHRRRTSFTQAISKWFGNIRIKIIYQNKEVT